MSISIFSEGLEVLCKRQGTQSPELAIRGACAMLVASCGVMSPPVPLTPLLKKMGILVEYTRDHTIPEGKAASLIANGDGLKIIIKEQMMRSHWRRMRFSIAHEIGHAVLYHLLGDSKMIASLDKTPEALKQLERVCNVAASEILMPTTMLRAMLKTTDLSPDGLLKLYDTFLVSKEALLRALAEVIPAGSVIFWKKYARNSSEPNVMRVQSSFPYYQSTFRPWLPKGCTTKHIQPQIVNHVVNDKKYVFENDLVISLGKKRQPCFALATFFPFRPQEQLPFLNDFVIPDEPVYASSSSENVIVFAADKTMSSSSFLWKTK